MSTLKVKTLPDPPSSLIRLAVTDLELVEVDDKYNIDMYETWHTPAFKENADNFDEDDVVSCTVCFAGSVMAKSLEYYSSYDVNVNEESQENQLKFNFLNSIRLYQVDQDYLYYLEEIGLPVNFPFTNDRLEVRVQKLEKVIYSKNPELFKTNMLKIADLFEEEGL